jgi:hypothetical protein
MTVYVNKQGLRVETVSADADEVVFYPAGGGFQMSCSAQEFAMDFSLEPPDANPWIHTKLGIDGYEERFYGYANKARWNGWAMPCFEHYQVTKMAEFFGLSFDSMNNVWFRGLAGSDEYEDWTPTEISVNGQTLVVFTIGSGSWCWDNFGSEA